jgi:hypothetical protein
MTRFGSLYTIFLHSPLLAFALVADIKETNQKTWTDALYVMARLERSVIEKLLTNQEFGKSWIGQPTRSILLMSNP